jgi:hypothetical protein
MLFLIAVANMKVGSDFIRSSAERVWASQTAIGLCGE